VFLPAPGGIVKRETKFRFWEGEYKAMKYPEFDIYPKDQDWPWDAEERFIVCRGMMQQDYDVMQFTGLKDAKGRKTSEGDVIRPIFMNATITDRIIQLQRSRI
jgi:hypothetical protein